MANGANRLFDVIKQTGESTNGISSQVVSLTIKSVNPLILMRDDRLEIPAEFCILHKSLNIDTFRINDVVTAIVLNNGQQYFILYNNTAEEQGANYNDLSNKPKINNVTLIGNKTASDLDLDNYTNLDNKPKINGIELNGNKTSNDLGLLNKVINVVVANTDLNDYKEDGEFYFGVDYTPTNIPTGVNGWLKVITGIQGSDNIVKQIWYRHGTPNNNDYETYIRILSGGTWSNWKMFGMQSSIDSLNNNKVNKSGDTLTGELNFNNKNDYAAIRKTRTINGVDYNVNIGIGANQSGRMEFQDANNNVLGSVEARSDGHIWNGQNDKKLGEVANLTWGSALTFSLEVGRHALVMVGNDECLMLWMAGGETLNTTRLLGTSVQATSSGTTVTIKYSDNRNFTGNVIIS